MVHQQRGEYVDMPLQAASRTFVCTMHKAPLRLRLGLYVLSEMQMKFHIPNPLIVYLSFAMKSIRYRFNEQESKRPAHSTFLNYAAAIKDQGFSSSMVRRWFNKLVDRDDYDQAEKGVLLRYLYGLAKHPPGRPYPGQKMPCEAGKKTDSVDVPSFAQAAPSRGVSEYERIA